MTPKCLLLSLALCAALAGAGYVARETRSSGEDMTSAAGNLLDSLRPEQKARAAFAFNDKERTRWFFTPQQRARKSLRKGLPLEDMTAEQKELARALVRAGTSAEGYRKATTIMSLESILADLEKGGSNVRDPQWYFFSLFGTPSRSGRWGWRVEGHHLSLNFVVDRGKVLASTPAFFGANPAHVLSGPRQGLRTLPEVEDSARELFASLDQEHQKVALQDRLFHEIEEGIAAPHVGAPRGLAAARMTQHQRDLLQKLIDSYAHRLPADVAAHELEQVQKAGLDSVHFAFAQNPDRPGRPYTYRVQGPTFVIEFLNVQPDSAGNPANHIHSVWRNINGDFGLPAAGAG
jgi:hypothetical protein